MVTGRKYDVTAGDRFFIPHGTQYATMTHQGASYFWCSLKVANDGLNSDTFPTAENDAQQEAQEETPW